MTAPLPAALKVADISRFALRAAQLEKPNPIVAYWCDYWIVNQILSKGLHNADQESLTYTTTLMDKLEQFKAERGQEPAVTDDVAGKAYVEQFGLDTFARADNAVRANKATRQTADTFQAAATFLDLLQIWGAIEPEITQKIKFAKFHALRIAKAVKIGEDPNLSNPVLEPEPEAALSPLDLNDPDVQMLEGGTAKPRQPSVIEIADEADRHQHGLAKTSSLDQSLHPSRDASVAPQPLKGQRQPSVTEVPDEADKFSSRLARQSSLNESLHPSRAPSLPRPPPNDVSPLAPADAASFYKSSNDRSKPDVSPLNSPSEGERKSSIGGNYFPVVPTAQSTQPPPPAPSETSLQQAPIGFSQPRAQPPPPPPQHHGHFLPQDPLQQQPIIPPNFQPNPSFPPQQPVLPAAGHHSPHHRGSHGPIPPVPPPSMRQQQQQPQQPPFTAPQYTQQFSSPPQSAVSTHSMASSIPPPSQPQSAIAAPSSNIVVDEEAMMKAQKHARWAISAMNFEDVPTAIRELRAALTDLGGA